MNTNNPVQERIQQQLTHYLGTEYNKNRLKQILQQNKKILPLDLDHMRDHTEKGMVEEIKMNPTPYIIHMSRAISEIVEQVRPQLDLEYDMGTYPA